MCPFLDRTIASEGRGAKETGSRTGRGKVKQNETGKEHSAKARHFKTASVRVLLCYSGALQDDTVN